MPTLKDTLAGPEEEQARSLGSGAVWKHHYRSLPRCRGLRRDPYFRVRVRRGCPRPPTLLEHRLERRPKIRVRSSALTLSRTLAPSMVHFWFCRRLR